jgi:hypothetical protein
MNILWAGGEDVDFPIMGNATVVTTGGRFRSGWARCAINMSQSTGSPAKSAPFSGGAVTSAWLSFQMYNQGPISNSLFAGFGLSGTNKWLGVGSDSSNSNRVALVKYDGSTRTQLAAEGGSSMAGSVLTRFDIQVTNYGTTATVNVYVNGVAILTFTGDVTVSGMTNFDSVFVMFWNNGGGGPGQYSEMFVADSDTRAVQGLQTLALTGAGTTNAWSNDTFSNINGISFSDSNPTYSNTAAQDQQYTVTTPTPVTYSVLAVSQSARLARPATATTSQVKLGYKNGATGAFGTGATKTPGVGFALATQIDQINPVTGVAFTQSDLASLQLDMQSA